MRQLLCLSFLLLPVAAAPDEKPAEDPHRMKPGDAPTPYTAEEIRKACPAGRTDVMRNENLGKVATVTQKFVKCDENGTEVELTIVMEEGTPPRSEKRTSTWKEVQAHSSFPEADTKITEETIEVPAGKFDCWLYVVNGNFGGKAVKRTMYFAKKLPGPPVKMEVELDGKVVSTLTLLEHKDAAEEAKPPEGQKPPETPKPPVGDEPSGG